MVVVDDVMTGDSTDVSVAMPAPGVYTGIELQYTRVGVQTKSDHTGHLEALLDFNWRFGINSWMQLLHTSKANSSGSTPRKSCLLQEFMDYKAIETVLEAFQVALLTSQVAYSSQ
mmetsp:Transcript_15534/g.25438  ORF Transcript_15534/g.25438 Transcript_15534/m.25438 type:complete len:115 (+) Transcript_15534:221-565(+)